MFRCDKCGETARIPKRVVVKKYPNGNIAKEENWCNLCVSNSSEHEPEVVAKPEHIK